MLQPTKNVGKSNHRCAIQPQHHQTHITFSMCRCVALNQAIPCQLVCI